MNRYTMGKYYGYAKMAKKGEYVKYDDVQAEIDALVDMLEDVVQDIYDDERRYRIDSYKRTVKEEYAKREALEAEIDELVDMLERVRDCKDMSQDEIEALIANHRE